MSRNSVLRNIINSITAYVLDIILKPFDCFLKKIIRGLAITFYHSNPDLVRLKYKLKSFTLKSIELLLIFLRLNEHNSFIFFPYTELNNPLTGCPNL